MSDAAAPAPAAPDAEDQMEAALNELRQERATDGAAPAPAPSPADAPAPADAAAPRFHSNDAVTDVVAKGDSPAPASSQAPAAPAPAAAQDPATLLQQTQQQLQQARSELGRVGALNRNLSEARTELNNARQELARLKAAAPSAAQTADAGAAKAIEDLEAKAKEFPELAPLLNTVTAALKATHTQVTATVKESLDKGLAPVVELRAEQNIRQQETRAAAYKAAMQTFETTYPNAVEVVRSSEFKDWIATQPQPIQTAFYQGQDPAEAIAVMDAYDAALRRAGKATIAVFPTAAPAPAPAAAAPKPSNTARLDRAAGLPSRNSGAKGGMPAEDDFDSSLEFFRRQRLANQQRAA